MTPRAVPGGGGYEQSIQRMLACDDCPAEVRVTVGSDQYLPYRARVIHLEDCAWLANHRLGRAGFGGPVPCSTSVTHRGPYKRDPGY